MPSLGGVIDPATVKPADGFDVIPAGTIALAHITESTVGPTKDGKGKKVEATWEILDGQYKGRKIWDTINIINANPQAAEIGQRHLSAICVATGVGATDNTDRLHFKPCLIKIGVQPAKGNYPEKNKVSAVKAVGTPTGAAPGPAQAGWQQPPAQSAQPAAAQTWQQPAAARPVTPQPGGVPWANNGGNQAPF